MSQQFIRSHTKKDVSTCPDCHTKISPRLEKCTICFLKHKARSYFGNRKKWTFLKEIFDKQQGVCPYTGIHLTLGHNCTIDHIIPKALGGKTHISNLQWVFKDINSMKGSLSEKEFFVLVSLIYHHTTITRKFADERRHKSKQRHFKFKRNPRNTRK